MIPVVIMTRSYLRGCCRKHVLFLAVTLLLDDANIMANAHERRLGKHPFRSYGWRHFRRTGGATAFVVTGDDQSNQSV
ncbi:hypothetical protein PC116_g27071 [Phytophthora cactorum]|nr:hypothetical protein PC120_g17580 [Phytophthora cactorum]KAG3011011.1 hypothetical protein PC119_g13342 [Phytophthora cactorum]KAG4224476.1 hypothetical protein PC116_g27071 [Phytophthora cactorum]